MRLIVIVVAVVLSDLSLAWDGYDYESSSFIEIDEGNLVRPGQDIEIYDYRTGEYKSVEVQSIDGSGPGTEVEVYDYGSGKYRTFDMD